MTTQPTPNGTGPDIAGLVHLDLEARVKKGEAEYGQRLKPHNGRDALWDLYEELLDAAMYARQAIYERDNPEPSDHREHLNPFQAGRCVTSNCPGCMNCQ
jgi:hypothetical protein